MITIDEIKREVAARHGVSPLDLDSDRRTARLTRARHLAMALARRMTPHSLPAIGRQFGGRTHVAVMLAVRRMEERCPAELDALERDLAATSPGPKREAERASATSAATASTSGPTRLTRAVAAVVAAARRLEDERYGAGEAGARAALERAVKDVVDACTR